MLLYANCSVNYNVEYINMSRASQAAGHDRHLILNLHLHDELTDL